MKTEPVPASPFVLEMRHLHRAQIEAATPDDRDIATHALAQFIRLNSQGRVQEWFDAKAAAARNDA